ncbi:hypothetical protein, partial [uncultured Gammaproteobacteria bacterium]
MTQIQQKTLIATTIIIAIAGLITSLNISNPEQSDTSVFN